MACFPLLHLLDWAFAILPNPSCAPHLIIIVNASSTNTPGDERGGGGVEEFALSASGCVPHMGGTGRSTERVRTAKERRLAEVGGSVNQERSLRGKVSQGLVGLAGGLTECAVPIRCAASCKRLAASNGRGRAESVGRISGLVLHARRSSLIRCGRRRGERGGERGLVLSMQVCARCSDENRRGEKGWAETHALGSHLRTHGSRILVSMFSGLTPSLFTQQLAGN